MRSTRSTQRRVLGSARVSRAGDGVHAIANFSCDVVGRESDEIEKKACFDVTPKPARETRALPRMLLPARSHYAREFRNVCIPSRTSAEFRRQDHCAVWR